jgi:hypothetical protein
MNRQANPYFENRNWFTRRKNNAEAVSSQK